MQVGNQVYTLSIGAKSFWSSRWDRYLGMTAAMTQVPVPTAIKKEIRREINKVGKENKKIEENE